MTDNEIIKALECCSNPLTEECCNGCPLCGQNDTDACVSFMSKQALDLINRQKAEIEALINGQETLEKHIKKQKEEIDNLTNIIKTRNRDNERLTLENLQMIASIKGLESKAYKEFAERLKEKKIDVDVSYGYGREVYTEAVAVVEIDNLLEEMESERE